MNGMEIREAMAAKGWHSEDRMTTQGWGDKVGYSIWFSRYDWHGKRTLVLVGSKACYHCHTGDLWKIDEIIERAADRAERAYKEFPDCPPDQGVGGALVARKPISGQEVT